ncbi:MAG: enolase [Armatimonadetes bacterium]|nr:enolase [Armatimonadota bacterium]MDW8121725.1 enolase C-terminal domain-like protein [Armatimonadota bacterium]
MRELKVVKVERVTVDIPFSEHCAPFMSRHLRDWSVSEVCIVSSDNGLTGVGETIPFYTWGRVTEEAIQRVIGANPFDLLYDDSLGAGLQMALWDLAGKAVGAPIYALMGQKVRDGCPIAWWAIDMPPEDWAKEAAQAVASGYTAFKLKARPWYDIFEQVKAISEVTPPHFRLDLDFNAFLLNSSNALPILDELEDFSKVAMFETPIHQWDVEGNKQIRRHIEKPIAHHYGSPPIITALKEQVCDGFVVSGGAASVLRQGIVCAEFNKPFFLQLVGTGLTTAWTFHLGAVLTHAQWPAITCLNIYSDDLLTEPLTIEEGYGKVPEGPGLGVTLDEEALERYRVELPLKRETKRKVYVVVWDSGRAVCYGSPDAYHQDFYAGNQPVSHRGVRLEELEDDGSAHFEGLYEKVQRGPVVSRWPL